MKEMKFETWFETTKTAQEIKAWEEKCSERERLHGATRELRWEEMKRWWHEWEKQGSLSWQTYEICKHAPCLIATDTIHRTTSPATNTQSYTLHPTIEERRAAGKCLTLNPQSRSQSLPQLVLSFVKRLCRQSEVPSISRVSETRVIEDLDESPVG